MSRSIRCKINSLRVVYKSPTGTSGGLEFHIPILLSLGSQNLSFIQHVAVTSSCPPHIDAHTNRVETSAETFDSSSWICLMVPFFSKKILTIFPSSSGKINRVDISSLKPPTAKHAIAAVLLLGTAVPPAGLRHSRARRIYIEEPMTR